LLLMASRCLGNAFVTVFFGQTRIAWRRPLVEEFCEG
jgi:hypothetical protein